MASAIIIREIDSILEMKALERVQKEVWGWDDLDTMPLMNFIVTKEVGGVLIGAFEGEKPVGFAFGFVGFDEGRVLFHSHMLAVLPGFRERGIGYRLKVAQRKQALEKGFDCITWTFDPLQSQNAHLNFSKLGVIAHKYKVNFYGEQTSSALHQHIGTDRLWVSWFLNSSRVKRRLGCGPKTGLTDVVQSIALPLVQRGSDGWPQSHLLGEHTKGDVLIDIPPDIGFLQQANPELAVAWRKATRSAFTDALNAGYRVEEFYRLDKNCQSAGSYLLRKPDGICDYRN